MLFFRFMKYEITRYYFLLINYSSKRFQACRGSQLHIKESGKAILNLIWVWRDHRPFQPAPNFLLQCAYLSKIRVIILLYFSPPSITDKRLKQVVIIPFTAWQAQQSTWMVIWKVVFSVLQPQLRYCWRFWHSELNIEELPEITCMASIYLYFPALWPSKDIQSFTCNFSLLLYCSAGLGGLPREIYGQLATWDVQAVPKKPKQA